jgi:hypothetical protein
VIGLLLLKSQRRLDGRQFLGARLVLQAFIRIADFVKAGRYDVHE